jgi:uncharacterized protein
MTFVLVSVVLGIIVGVVSSLFGIGGGIFIVPMLPSLLSMTHHQAIATSLAAVFLVTLLNTVGFARENLVNWRTGLLLGVPSGIMAFVSGPWAAAVGDTALRVFFLFILFVLLIITFFRRNLPPLGEEALVITKAKGFFALLFALVAGFVSAFTGIGAGVILSPIMFNLKMVRSKELVPTTNLSTMLTTFSGSLSYFLIDLDRASPLIDKPLALSLFLVATLTALWMRPLQKRLSQSTKVVVLCGVLFFIILKEGYELYAMHVIEKVINHWL